MDIFYGSEHVAHNYNNSIRNIELQRDPIVKTQLRWEGEHQGFIEDRDDLLAKHDHSSHLKKGEYNPRDWGERLNFLYGEKEKTVSVRNNAVHYSTSDTNILNSYKEYLNHNRIITLLYNENSDRICKSPHNRINSEFLPETPMLRRISWTDSNECHLLDDRSKGIYDIIMSKRSKNIAELNQVFEHELNQLKEHKKVTDENNRYALRCKNPFVFFTSNQNLLKFYIHYMASKDFPIIHMQKYNQVYEKILKIAIHEELFTKPVMHFGRFQISDYDDRKEHQTPLSGLLPRGYTPLLNEYTKGWLVGDNRKNDYSTHKQFHMQRDEEALTRPGVSV